MIDKGFPGSNNFVLSAEAQREIDRKAKELFEKRIGPHAVDISPVHREAILKFQRLIFTVDHYFEQNKVINPVVVNSFLKQSETFLCSLGMPSDLQITLMQDIKDYIDIEASTRQGKKLADYEIRYFYLKKSCDVRIQRHIIRYLNQEPTSSSPEEITRDLLEEIEDDIDDIEEDTATPFNGNRFLELLNSGDISRIQEYLTFINSLDNAPIDLVRRIRDKINKLAKQV